jgi:pyruvate dehydrogenase E1 component alpha subunit
MTPRSAIRSAEYIPELRVKAEAEIVERIWSKWMFNRAFELEVARAIQEKQIYVPTYLSLGSEHVPVTLFEVYQEFELFAQHRAHSYYLSRGGDPHLLRDELLGHKHGLNGGRGGSASIASAEIQMWGHSGLMGDQVPLAVGYCLATGAPTMTVFGDASGEEDYVLSSFGYAAKKRLPILFVCEDNDLSILTEVSIRRDWNIVEVARSFGLNAQESSDDPFELLYWAHEMNAALPALINIHVARDIWHAGSGTDGPPQWNRKKLFEAEMISIGFGERLRSIEAQQTAIVREIWAAG